MKKRETRVWGDRRAAPFITFHQHQQQPCLRHRYGKMSFPRTCALGLPHLNACESMMGPNGWKDDGRGDNTDDAAETSEGFDKWEFFVSAPTMIPGVCGPRVCARK